METDREKRCYKYHNHEANDAPHWFIKMFAIAYVVGLALAITWIGHEFKTNTERFDGQLIQGMEKYNEQ